VSKTVLNQLTASLVREFKSQGSKVTVNAIQPGWVPTAMTNFTGPGDIEVQTGLIVETIERLAAGETGRFMAVKGEDFPW
jgi:NAD(P)-dependent dehydrogenase (short-subunit alcohol dehydrogenase family)